MALFMYSFFSDNLPSYFTNYFKLNETIHIHIPRGGGVPRYISDGNVRSPFLGLKFCSDFFWVRDFGKDFFWG